MSEHETASDNALGVSSVGAVSPLPTLGRNHVSLSDAISATLRQHIFDGVLPAGERLTEARLSRQMGVSRIPVREALRTLAAEGLVEMTPRRGASVARFSPTSARDLIRVHATLEGLAARLAAESCDDAARALLRQLLADGRQAHDDGALEALADVNQRVHRLLGELAANTVLDELMRLLHDRTATLFAPRDPQRAQHSWREHAQIVEAVINGDAELAALLASHHIHSAARPRLPD